MMGTELQLQESSTFDSSEDYRPSSVVELIPGEQDSHGRSWHEIINTVILHLLESASHDLLMRV